MFDDLLFLEQDSYTLTCITINMLIVIHMLICIHMYTYYVYITIHNMLICITNIIYHINIISITS